MYKSTARQILGTKRTKRTASPRAPIWATAHALGPREFGLHPGTGISAAQHGLEERLTAHSEQMWSAPEVGTTSGEWELINFLRARGGRSESGKAQLLQNEAVDYHKKKFGQPEQVEPEAEE